MKHILVTGGFGFLGGHLIEELLNDKNNHVHVVDNLSTSPLPLEYLLSLIENKKNLTYDIQDLHEYRSKQKYDEIYHLASVVGPVGILNHSGNIVKSICRDTYYVINLAISTNTKLLNVSTSEVYGGGREGLCSEDMPTIIQSNVTIRLEYAVAKLAAEIAITNLINTSSLKAIIARPFNISGPRQSGKAGFVLPRFIIQAMNNEPLTVFNKGNQVRAFTHVKDTVLGLINAMKYGRIGEKYNIGNKDNRTSILQLAKEVIKFINSNSEIIFVDPKTIYGEYYTEANDKYPEDTKAKMEIEWLPLYDIKKVIEDTYDFMNSINNPKIFECLK